MEEVFADLHVHIGRSESNKPIKITAAQLYQAVIFLMKYGAITTMQLLRKPKKNYYKVLLSSRIKIITLIPS